MTTKNITPTALGKMIAAETLKDRSYLKEIFDRAESYELLNQGIIKALGFLGQVEQDEASKKLTSYVRHYFAPTVLSQIQLLVDNLYRAPGSGRNYAASS